MPIIALVGAERLPAWVQACEPDPAAILEAVAEIDPRADVLLLANDAAGHDAARSARLSLFQERIGLAYREEPVTELFVMAAALHMLPADSLGLADGVLDAVRRASTTIAELSSVSSLVRPSPSFAQHAAGAVPGARFVVDWSAGTVRRGTAPDPGDGVVVVTAASVKPLGEEPEPVTSRGRVELTTDDGGRWGASRWRERTVLHLALEEIVGGIVRDAAAGRHPRCPSCSRVGAGMVCIFCQLGLSSQTPVDVTNGATA